jgi:Leucine-rich repeat (LRR) protein
MKSTTVLLSVVVLVLSCSTDRYYQYGHEKWRIEKNPNLSRAKKLKALDLSRDPTPPIQEDIFSLYQLEYLNLNNKEIKELPMEICELRSLRFLFLSGNSGIQLPECLKELSNLQVITLHGCQLNSVPTALYQLKNLQSVLLTGNNIPRDQIMLLRSSLPAASVVDTAD